MAVNSNLQQYIDSQVATISPFKLRSQELLDQAESHNITDEQTAKEAVAIRKAITAHRAEVKNARLEITRNFDKVKTQFIAAENDILEPAEQALKNIGEKILAYQEEQERIAREEATRIANIEAKFKINAKSSRHRNSRRKRFLMATPSWRIYHSKNHPRPKPIGYIISPERKRFPRYLFDKNHDPIYSAMEEYRNRNYRYPLGVTPIYEDNNNKGEQDNAGR